MIELVIIDYLKERLDVEVLLEEPKNTSTFVLIEKTGGGEINNFLNVASIAVKSYAGSLYDAALLNEKVKSVMKNLADLDEVSKVSLNSDYEFTDTTSKRYRYQAIFDVIFY